MHGCLARALGAADDAEETVVSEIHQRELAHLTAARVTTLIAWALYAEQLAEEMGLYEIDPLGRIGYLHDALWRASRLVMDTGLHAMRWSREQAISYYIDTLGTPESSVVTEVERYCVWPGQACSYMVGKLTWLRLREQAKQALGDRFDIREFHDAGLLSGAMPLTVLDAVVTDYLRVKNG